VRSFFFKGSNGRWLDVLTTPKTSNSTRKPISACCLRIVRS